MQEIQAQFLGREDPLGEEMATHSSVLDWEIPQTEEPTELQSMESRETRLSDQTTVINDILNSFSCAY